MEEFNYDAKINDLHKKFLPVPEGVSLFIQKNILLTFYSFKQENVFLIHMRSSHFFLVMICLFIGVCSKIYIYVQDWKQKHSVFWWSCFVRVLHCNCLSHFFYEHIATFSQCNFFILTWLFPDKKKT